MQRAVRIIGGRFRGKKLPVTDVTGLRPTSDRIRETLFNWLMNDIRGARCLDLFAGTGALGFEAFSRGAKHVLLIEQSSKAFQQLTSVARTFNDDAISVQQHDALSWIRQTKQSFDVIFLDPPFNSTLAIEAIAIIEQRRILSVGGLLYWESDCMPTVHNDCWHQIKMKKAGQVFYSLWCFQPKESSHT